MTSSQYIEVTMSYDEDNSSEMRNWIKSHHLDKETIFEEDEIGVFTAFIPVGLFNIFAKKFDIKDRDGFVVEY